MWAERIDLGFELPGKAKFGQIGPFVEFRKLNNCFRLRQTRCPNGAPSMGSIDSFEWMRANSLLGTGWASPELRAPLK
jgi:hypothetical protein